MKKPSNRRKNQGPIRPEIIRHYETLSQKETDEVVDAVADLIINFVKKRPKSGITSPESQEPGLGKSGPR